MCLYIHAYTCLYMYIYLLINLYIHTYTCLSIHILCKYVIIYVYIHILRGKVYIVTEGKEI